MRYGIFSDIHSNLEALDKVIKAYEKESIDTYLCAGDVVGYATNPKECIEKVKSLASMTVAGNHDWATVNLFSLEYFNPLAEEALLWTRKTLDDKERYFLETLKLIYENKDLTLVHGTLDNPQEFDYMTDEYTAKRTSKILKTNICFVGHTHVAGIFIEDNQGNLYYNEEGFQEILPEHRYIVNVGSVGQPRDNNPKAAYCIYDTERKEIQIKRVDYDMETARKKIISCGLPRFLGDRLFVGR